MKRVLQHPIVQAVLAWLRAHPREGAVLGAIIAVLIGPLLLKPADTTTPRRWDRRLVIVTPHPGLIRDELAMRLRRIGRRRRARRFTSTGGCRAGLRKSPCW